MVIAFDLDKTLDAHCEIGSLMRDLKCAGNRVIVISGYDQKVTDAIVAEKRARLDGLGLSDAYDELVAVDGPQSKVAQRKALYLKSVGCGILVDNSLRNARACSDAGILCLVPWNTRSEY